MRLRSLTLGALLLTIFLVSVSAASAEDLSPWWGVTSGSRPTNLVSGENGQIVVTAQNRGDVSTGGEVKLVDQLPAGLEAVGIEGSAGGALREHAVSVSCVLSTLTCIITEPLRPYEEIEMDITVSVKDVSSGERNTATVSGGGYANAVSASHRIEVDGSERFGIEDYQVIPENAGGSFDIQAGSHPFQLTSIVTLNTSTPDGERQPRTVALPKDISSELPAGFLANPTLLPQCTERQFAQRPHAEPWANECPAESAVGVATVTFDESLFGEVSTITVPIFNMTPEPGDPARFGFEALAHLSAFIDTSIRAGSDYGVTIIASNITQAASLLSLKLTFWGVPGDPRHDDQRGWECLEGVATCRPPTETTQAPFLVMPTSCQAPFQSTVRGDSWGSSEDFAGYQAEPLSYTLAQAVGGCNRVPVAASLVLTSGGSAASSPTGLNLDVHVPQASAPGAEALVDSTVRGITVTLPEGLVPNPGGADGLQACSESQVGFAGVQQASGTDLFTSSLPRPLCPDAAKVGTVRIKTALLANPLEGAAYLATQNENPFGSLVAIYLIAEDPVSGTLVRLAGELSVNGESGRITATFRNSPQLPFEDLELRFFGGERAPLASPAHCGSYAAQASFLPWSGGQPVKSTSNLDITTGPNGGPCPGTSLPFSPSLTAGTLNNRASSSSPFTTTVGLQDGSESLRSFELHMPPGLSALLAEVPLCGEPQADEGTCGSQSLIGETTLSVGVGDDPYNIEGGRVYVTGPYEGAPFGLSIVDPAKAGPLDLEDTPEHHPHCDCVVVRARIEVDPRSAQLTIATDSAGPYAIPQVIGGVPVLIKDLRITISRPGLTLNPTSCGPLAVTASLLSAEGASLSRSVPFRVADCAKLRFSPTLTALTRADGEFSGHGASLHVVIRTAPGQANMRSLKLNLPRRLPARLETIQHACPEHVFNADPAACPKTSVIGSAEVNTPVLAAPLTGPAFLIAKQAAGASGAASASGHGAFPDIVLVLQAQGVRIDLTGVIYLTRQDITSTTFSSIPDLPIRRLDLILPEGRRSVLAAGSNLCRRTLHMSTAITAQNGSHHKRTVTVAVSGCKYRAHR